MRAWQLGGLGLLAGAALGQSACAPEASEDAAAEVGLSQQELGALRSDVILDWNLHTNAALITHNGYADPLAATRTLTLVHLAMHDAINATSYRLFESYAFEGRDRWAHPTAAAAAAAHGVLIQLFPAQTSDLDAQLAESLKAVPDGALEQRGVKLGQQVADALLAARADDGAGETLPYTPGSEPGDYQFTTPGVIAAPGWENVTPWGLASADQFRPEPQPALDSERYARDFDEVKQKGNLGANTRTAEETRIAQFWYEFSDIGWNRAAREVAVDQRLGLAQAARFMALVNMALADGYIAGWDAKFHYDFWRPVTAIQAAAQDGNDATVADPGWASFLFTPPVQDYPSTHSLLGAAAAEVMTRFFGARGRRLGFSMTSGSASEPNVEVRSFRSFRQAARENSESRVLAGLHFRFSCEAGLTQGAAVGRYIVENALRPLY